MASLGRAAARRCAGNSVRFAGTSHRSLPHRPVPRPAWGPLLPSSCAPASFAPPPPPRRRRAGAGGPASGAAGAAAAPRTLDVSLPPADAAAAIVFDLIPDGRGQAVVVVKARRPFIPFSRHAAARFCIC